MVIIPREQNLLHPEKPHSLKESLTIVASGTADAQLILVRNIKAPLHEHSSMASTPIGGVDGYCYPNAGFEPSGWLIDQFQSF